MLWILLGWAELSLLCIVGIFKLESISFSIPYYQMLQYFVSKVFKTMSNRKLNGLFQIGGNEITEKRPWMLGCA